MQLHYSNTHERKNARLQKVHIRVLHKNCWIGYNFRIPSSPYLRGKILIGEEKKIQGLQFFFKNLHHNVLQHHF